MVWQTPKTNWSGTTNDEGVYTGDYFNAADFNRIKNNLELLYNLAIKLYDDFGISDIGVDKTVSDYFYADEFNKIEQNLDVINKHTLNRPYGELTTFVDNGRVADYEELNRIEKATLDLYERLVNQAKNRRMFTWNFGTEGGF